MEEVKHKLNYKIVGKTTTSFRGEAKNATQPMNVDSNPLDIDHYQVEWTHDDGPVQDMELICVGWDKKKFDKKVNPWVHEERPTEKKRTVIEDQIDVRSGTPQSVVIAMLEEKRERLAKNLGIDP